jgi:two-component system sensor kinase FixL
MDENGCIQHFGVEAELLFGYQEATVLDRNIRVLMPAPGQGGSDSDHDRDDNEPGCSGHWQGGDWRLPSTGEYRGTAISPHHVTKTKRVVLGRRADGGTFPMEVLVRDAHVPGERLFTAAIRDLTLIVKRDLGWRKLQSELLRVAHLGELDHLASTLMRKVIQPVSTIRDDLCSSQGLLNARDEEAARLAMARLLEIAECTVEMVLELRGIAAPAAGNRLAEDLAAIIDVAIGLALEGLRQRLTITIQIAANADRAVIDGDQIQQVLTNLISHVVRAMASPARREITIATALMGDMVEIRVSDTSPVRPETLAPLCQPHAGGDAGTGLSFCRAIVNQHGGELHAENGVGDGALFRFTVPRGQTDPVMPVRDC